MRGSAALSGYKIAKLKEGLLSEGIEVSSVSTHFVHLVDVTEPLNDKEQEILAKILTYGPVRAELAV